MIGRQRDRIAESIIAELKGLMKPGRCIATISDPQTGVMLFKLSKSPREMSRIQGCNLKGILDPGGDVVEVHLEHVEMGQHKTFAVQLGPVPAPAIGG